MFTTDTRGTTMDREAQQRYWSEQGLRVAKRAAAMRADNARHTDTHLSLERARDAARTQVERIGGMSGLRDCTVVVTHRDGPDVFQSEHYRACPACGHWTIWDTLREPQAWRHESGWRWCLATEGNGPTMPDGWNEDPTQVLVR